MRELSAIDFLIFSIAFFSGILAHEGAHLIICHALKLDPKLDVLSLNVICKKPKTNFHMRLIGLAPLFLFLIVFLHQLLNLAYSKSTFFNEVISYPLFLPVSILNHFHFATLLFLIGLIIGLSASDISLKVQKSELGKWQAWAKAPHFLKLGVGGVLIYLITKYLQKIPLELLTPKDTQFILLMGFLLEISYIVIFMLSICIFLWNYKE